MAGRSEETAVTWFKALVEEDNGRDTIVTGPTEFRFTPDGNSLTITYADGRIEKLML